MKMVFCLFRQCLTLNRFDAQFLVLKESKLQRNSLYRAARIAKYEGILGFSVPSIILLKAGLMQITM